MSCLALALLVACGGGERTAAPAAPAPAAPAPAASAPAPSAADAGKLVSELYREHDAGRSPFFQTESRERLDRYFEPALAELIWKDVVDSKGEVGALDFDPLYDAQDVEAKNLVVQAAPPAGANASVTVTFENHGTQQQIRYSLAPAGGAWKIADIIYGDGRTLSGVYRTPGP